MNQKPNARHLIICLTVLSAVFASAFSELAKATTTDDSSAKSVRAYRMNGNYNLRSATNQESQKFGTLSKTDDVGMKFSPVKNDEKWFKVDLDNGGSGFVNRNALKQVELNGNYVIHSDASLTSHRVGLVSQTKRPEDLVLTGNQKMVQENGKKIEWLEVMANGKKAWVAGGAVSNANTKVDASTKSAKTVTKQASSSDSVPLPVPRPKEFKVDSKTTLASKPKSTAAPKTAEKKSDEKSASKIAAKPAAKSTSKPEAKPTAKVVAKSEKPATPPATKDAKKPEAKQVAVKPPVVKVNPVVVDPSLAAKKTVAKKNVPPIKVVSDETHAIPPENIPGPASQIAPPPEVVAKPEAVAKAPPLKDVECASAKSDYMANSRLREAYGRNYDPFVPWHHWCVDATPNANGTWVLDICFIGQMKGNPARMVVPASICYNFKTKEAWTVIKGVKSPFNGHEFNHLALINENGETANMDRVVGGRTAK